MRPAGDGAEEPAQAAGLLKLRAPASLRALATRRRIEALLWIALAVFVGHRVWPQIAAAFGVASSNAQAPAFQLTTLDGRTLSSDSLRGRVVLVNFWATWCPPCRVEMPGFQSVYDEHERDGFVVVGISTDRTGSDGVRQYVAEHHITYPIAMATGDVVQNFGGVYMLPSSFLIDRHGRIRNEVRGIFAAVTLRSAVQRLLAEQ